jgi:CheY-like chemotaxis protein
MPVLDGPEATRRIRAGAAGEAASRLPIIAITAHAMGGDAQRCLDAGMNQCLAKPFTLPELADALGRVLPQVAPAARA